MRDNALDLKCFIVKLRHLRQSRSLSWISPAFGHRQRSRKIDDETCYVSSLSKVWHRKDKTLSWNTVRLVWFFLRVSRIVSMERLIGTNKWVGVPVSDSSWNIFLRTYVTVTSPGSPLWESHFRHITNSSLSTLRADGSRLSCAGSRPWPYTRVYFVPLSPLEYTR